MVNESRSSNQKRIVVLAVVALVLVIAALAVILTLVLRGGSKAGAEVAESAKLMPQDTFSFMAFNPHLDQARNYEVLEKAWGDNPTVQKALSDMLSSMTEGGVDYKADIEAWLGDEVSFSMGAEFLAAMQGSLGQLEGALEGEFDSPPTGLENPQFTLAVETKDRAASDRFLDKLRGMAAEEGATFQETDYKGIKIQASAPQAAGEPSVAFATVGNFVVVAVGGLEQMQAAIDAQDGANLADDQTFKDVLAKLPEDQIGYGYMDTSAYMEATAQALESQLAQLPPGLFNLDQLQAAKAVGYSIGLEANGISIDMVSIYDRNALPEDMPGTQALDVKTTERVPADVLFYIAGSGLDQLATMGIEAAKGMSGSAEEVDEQLKMATAMLGVSVDDLMEMLSGEFALAITHDPAGIAGQPSVPVGVSFLLQAADEDKFERLINSVSGLLSLSGEMEMPKETIGDVEVTTVADPSSGNMMAGWGVGKGFFAIGTSKAMLETAFGAGGDKLADAATFKAAVDPLPDKRTGLFYMNMQGLMELVSGTMDPWAAESFEEGRAFLEPIKAFAAAAEPISKEQDSASGRLFILIEGE